MCSIETVGMLHLVVLVGEYHPVSGHGWLEVFCLLGWTHIWARVVQPDLLEQMNARGKIISAERKRASQWGD